MNKKRNATALVALVLLAALACNSNTAFTRSKKAAKQKGEAMELETKWDKTFPKSDKVNH